MSSRTASRFLAVQTLYQLDLVPGEVEDAFAGVANMNEADGSILEYGKGLVSGTLARREDLDRLIAEHLSDSWTLARVGKVEKAILRLAAFELTRDHEVPTPVIIDEALELTRDFLDDGAVKFVNGVLDRLARTARPSADPAPEDG
jgi:N utilization substance protein B